MEFKFLPEKIKKLLGDAGLGNDPLIVFRSSGALDGSAGESYVIAYEGELCLFGRQLGCSDYITLKGNYVADITVMNIKQSKSNAELLIGLDGTDYKLKFSNFEKKNVETIIDLWQHATASDNNDVVEVTANAGELNAFAALAAGMMYVAGVDGEIAETEENYIRRICGVRKEDFRTGVEFYNNNSLEEFQQQILKLNEEQKLCILANMLDLAMIDGVLHCSEQDIIQSYVNNTDIDKNRSGAIIDVLEIKNHTAVLTG